MCTHIIFYKNLTIVQHSNNRLDTSIAHCIKNPIRRTNEQLQEFFNFSEMNLFFIDLKFYFLIKSGCILIDFDVIFSMQSS